MYHGDIPIKNLAEWRRFSNMEDKLNRDGDQAWDDGDRRGAVDAWLAAKHCRTEMWKLQGDRPVEDWANG